MIILNKLIPAIAMATAFASPALADSISLDSTKLGQTFTLDYNGFSDGTTIGGLTGQTSFTLTSITNNGGGGSIYSFDYSVTNTSSSPVTGSRISSFAFNTDPTISGASSTGAFAYTTLNSNYPNGIGTVDVCFKDASTGSCSGGGSGGLTLGQTGSGSLSLNFSQPVSALSLSDFYVRYQSISGVPGISSASGSGTVVTSTSTGGTSVPEPGALGLLATGLIAMGLMRGRRRRSLKTVSALPA